MKLKPTKGDLMILIFKTDQKFLHHPITTQEAKLLIKNHTKGKKTYKIKVRSQTIKNLIPDDLKQTLLKLNGKLPDEFLLCLTEKDEINYFDLTVNELIDRAFNKEMLCGILYTSKSKTTLTVLN